MRRWQKLLNLDFQDHFTMSKIVLKRLFSFKNSGFLYKFNFWTTSFCKNWAQFKPARHSSSYLKISIKRSHFLAKFYLILYTLDWYSTSEVMLVLTDLSWFSISCCWLSCFVLSDVISFCTKFNSPRIFSLSPEASCHSTFEVWKNNFSSE